MSALSLTVEPASRPAPSLAGDRSGPCRLASLADAPLSMLRPEAPGTLPRVACFAVQADADPGILPRVLGLFAKRSLVPHRLTGHRGRRDDGAPSAGPDDCDELVIDLQVSGLDAAGAEYLARCLRAIPGVVAVLTAEKAISE